MLTNSLNLPQPFVDAATSSHKYKPNRYSVTEVLGGTCEAVLKRRHQGEQDEDVADRVWAIFGTAVHKVLQEAKATDSQLQENWLAVPIKGTKYELSGIFDLYDDETKTVTDWKTCSVWKVTFGDFEDWRKQTLMYCWMLRQLEIDASRGEIVAIMRDHNQRKAKTEKDSPKHPVYKIGWDFSDKDFLEAENDIRRWFAEVADQEARESDELTPCSPERRWHKPDKWAVMRKGQKKAVRLFDSNEKALEHMDWLADQPSNKGRGLYIEFREGEDTRCQSYCSVAQFCPYWRANYAQ
jgi:hypothetical protein